MSSRRREPGVSWLGRFVRGWLPDRNPLRRPCDRAETAVLAALVIAFFAVAPFAAMACGAWVHAMGHRVQATQQASWYQVPADKRRMAAWDADWQATGRRWTRWA
jgi:hypothetical protein